MAGELGHLKCEHGVYLTLANIIVLAAGLLPKVGDNVTQSLQQRMLAWCTAPVQLNRAALLAVQDPKIVMSVLMKLAGGSPSLAPLFKFRGFYRSGQVVYDAVSASEIGEMLKGLQTQQLTHPSPSCDAREIDGCRFPDYQNLLKGDGL
jgi:Zn-dependent protease with chaperone function